MPLLAGLFSALAGFIASLSMRFLLWAGLYLGVIWARLEKWFYLLIFGGAAIGGGHFSGVLPWLLEQFFDLYMWLLFSSMEVMMSSSVSAMSQGNGRVPSPAAVFGFAGDMFISWARALGVWHAASLLIWAYFMKAMMRIGGGLLFRR